MLGKDFIKDMFLTLSFYSIIIKHYFLNVVENYISLIHILNAFFLFEHKNDVHSIKTKLLTYFIVKISFQKRKKK